MIFKLTDKDAGIERNSAVAPEKGVEPRYSQFLRSFCRWSFGKRP
jgi:hypothetical protein